MNPVETEAKIRVASFVAVKRRIAAQRGRLISMRALETNTLYDSPIGALRASGKSFRVRRYGKLGVLTLKGPATVAAGLKSRVELETSVESPETMASILEGLGFAPTFRYQKFREVWKVGSAVICLDETPLGRFVEIEGTAPAIFKAAAQLGLDPADSISASYPALWEASGLGGHMVFERGAASRGASRAAKARS